MSLLEKIEALNNKIDSGKNLLATAITDKGVSTTKTETLEAMANKIKQISGEGGPGLEPGSTIPADLLKPPTADEIYNGNPQYLSIEYNNKIYSCSLNGIDVLDKATGETSKLLSDFSDSLYLCIHNNKLYTIIKRISAVYLVSVNLDTSAEIKRTAFPSLTSYYGKAIDSCIVGDTIYVLFEKSSSKQYVAKLNPDVDGSTVIDILNKYDGNGVTDDYFYAFTSVGEHIFIFNKGFVVKVDGNLEFVNKVGIPNTYYDVEALGIISIGSFVYLKYKDWNYVIKINAETLEKEDVSHSYLSNGVHYIYKLKDYVIFNDFYGGNIVITDSEFAELYNIRLPKKAYTLNIFEVGGVKYLIAEDLNYNLMKYNLTSNKLEWILDYSNGRSYNSSYHRYKYNHPNNIAIISLKADNSKIFVNRYEYLIKSDMEPNYTINAKVLANMPDVANYLLGMQKQTLI